MIQKDIGEMMVMVSMIARVIIEIPETAIMIVKDITETLVTAFMMARVITDNPAVAITTAKATGEDNQHILRYERK